MKQITLFVIAGFTCMISFSQPRIVVAEYQKTQQPAVENEIAFPEKTVSKAIEERMEKTGYKGKDTKGFTVYKGVKMAEIGPDTYDLYFKTDRKSKKEKDNSIVTLMVSKGNENFISEATDTQVVANIKTYLESLKPVVEAYDLEQQIAEQEEVVKKADKKYDGLVDDGKDLEKKKKKLEEEISDNIKEQADQKKEAEKQKQIFETLKGKRK